MRCSKIRQHTIYTFTVTSESEAYNAAKEFAELQRRAGKNAWLSSPENGVYEVYVETLLYEGELL